ncbi:MAG: FAD-binding protein, partial [Oscillospiraceae bacterium]
MNYDVIVVGSGLAGLYATLNLSKDLKILLITKRDMLLNNSALAQGGIASVCDKINDNFDLHIKDTLIAGGYKNDLHHVEMLVKEGPANIKNMIENYNVDFDKNSDGSYHLTLEGGHCRHRIYHHKDCTGLEIVQKLSKAVMQLSNVTVKTFHQVENIKKVGNTFHLEVLDENGDFCYEKCHQLIMCSGGIGRVYEHTTNSAIATGDGIALSYNLGAKIKNLHLIQFHPTAFKNQDTRECFLISESVRGEGAYLLNGNKERFMQNYDERLELAPRDVVSSCIMKEAKKIGSDKFYLDITYKNAEAIKNRFPTIYEKLIEVGIDMTKDLIPVYPCHHYLMGGIDVNDNSQSSIEGLYACGECSHTGVHGNNRLASNSLLEA